MKYPFALLRPLAALSLLLLLALPALAQEGPGGPTTGSTSDLTGTMSAPNGRVKGLHYDAAIHEQRAPVSVECAASAPAGFTMHHGWSCADGTVTFDPPDAAATVARVAGPARVTIRCHLTATQSGSPTIHEGDATFGGGTGMAVVAIGGPVMVEIEPQSEPTFYNDYNDTTQSYFLTYYGYSHASPPPTYAQDTQDAGASVSYQPSGTTITWSIPASVYSAGLSSPFPHSQGIDLEAEGSFQNQPVHAHFHYSNNGLIGDADDDSDETEVNQGNIWLPLVYKISGHKPDHLTGVPGNPFAYVDTILSSGYQNYAQVKVAYILYDAYSGVMPGVWIQERYVDFNPLGLVINRNADRWTTKFVSVRDQSVAADDGRMEWDHLSYCWNGSGTWTTDHEYFAGTTSVAIGDSGISLGIYRITYTPGNSNFYQSGYANQSKLP